MTTKDPYKVLGVSRSATPEEVKKAYRALAKEHHPDRNPGNAAAEERFKEVNAAYDAITNPPAAAQQANDNGFGGSPFSADFWRTAEDIFGGGPQQRASARPGPQSQTRRPPEQPENKDWSTQFTDRSASRTAAPGAMELEREVIELTNKFNSYGGFVQNAIAARRFAHNEYQQRNPRAPRLDLDFAQTAPEIFKAEQLFDTLTRRDSAITLMEETSGLIIAAKNVTRPDLRAQAQQDVTQLSKRLDMRLAAITNALDVMAGRTDKLRYKPREKPEEAFALKL